MSQHQPHFSGSTITSCRSQSPGEKLSLAQMESRGLTLWLEMTACHLTLDVYFPRRRWGCHIQNKKWMLRGQATKNLHVSLTVEGPASKSIPKIKNLNCSVIIQMSKRYCAKLPNESQPLPLIWPFHQVLWLQVMAASLSGIRNVKLCCCCCLFSWVRLFVTPMDCSPPGSCLWDSPDKNTRVGCHFLLQEIFPTQGWNPCLLHWQTDSLPLSHQRKLCAYNYCLGCDISH